MEANQEIGLVVWHDYLAEDTAKAQLFYQTLTGWDYLVEHAKDFAWAEGEADYPLIMLDGHAHGGFVNLRRKTEPSWLAYVNVADVDETAARAVSAGGLVEREPFDVPGVGRNAILRDPGGARIGGFRPTHGFSAPKGAFLRETLVTDRASDALKFYGELFGWKVDGKEGDAVFRNVAGEVVAGVAESAAPAGDYWAPCLAAADGQDRIEEAARLGAATLRKSAPRLLADPFGAPFGLRQRRGSF